MNSSNSISKVIIIGSGPAGYTAAIYSARALLSPTLFTGSEIGGQLIQTTKVENFPGFDEYILGVDLMEKMKKQAKMFGTTIISETIESIDLSQRPFKCFTASQKYLTETIIYAAGSSPRWLNIKGEKEFKGHGVSSCATCDGFFYRDKKVAVIGGGNTATEEAIFLSRIAKEVILIHRRNELSSEKIMQEKLFQCSNVKFIWNSKVLEIYGSSNPKSVSGIKIHNLTNDNIFNFQVDGVFVAIGYVPQTRLINGQIKLDKENYILTKAPSSQTSVQGFFAAGDVADPAYRQAITAASSGCIAAMDAEKFLVTV